MCETTTVFIDSPQFEGFSRGIHDVRLSLGAIAIKRKPPEGVPVALQSQIISTGSRRNTALSASLACDSLKRKGLFTSTNYSSSLRGPAFPESEEMTYRSFGHSRAADHSVPTAVLNSITSPILCMRKSVNFYSHVSGVRECLTKRP